MGLSPTIWGRSGWHFIHAIAITFPQNPTDQQKKAYSDFFANLYKVLPCQLCSGNLQDKVKENPPPLTGPKEMFHWTVDLHNSVNRETGKPEIGYDQALKEFIKNSPPKSSTPRKYWQTKEGVFVFITLCAASVGIGYLIGRITRKN